MADVHRLYRFLLDIKPKAARRAVQAIRESVQILAQHHEVGRPVEGMDAEFREWPISYGGSGYVALYRITAGAALIVAARHRKEAGHLNDMDNR